MAPKIFSMENIAKLIYQAISFDNVSSNIDLVMLYYRYNCFPLSELLQIPPLLYQKLSLHYVIQALSNSSLFKDIFITSPNYIIVPHYQIHPNVLHFQTPSNQLSLNDFQKTIEDISGMSKFLIQNNDSFITVTFSNELEAFAVWRAFKFIPVASSFLHISAQIKNQRNHIQNQPQRTKRKPPQNKTTPVVTPRSIKTLIIKSAESNERFI